jgi:hypothetical protein
MAIPFPGTKFYEMVEKKGKFLHDLSVTSASADSGAVYELGSLRADGMNKMHRQAYREFYFRCSRIWHFLNRRIYSFRMVLGIFKSGLDMLFPKRQLKHVTD